MARRTLARLAEPLTSIALVLLFVVAAVGGARASAEADILWDTWGIPHIYAETEEDLLYAWGWAQMRSHGDLILEQVGITRGRAAALWGEAYLDSDRYLWTMGLPQLVEAYRTSMGEDTSFVDGMNAYAREHPEALDPRFAKALPITAEDTMALAFYDQFFNGLVVTPASIAELREAFLAGESARDPRPTTGEIGSNGWALAPSRSESGHALLLANPHAPWPTLTEARHLLLYEVQLVLPDLDFYGAGFLGLPAPSLGFNRDLGWTITSAPTFDFVDTYALTLADGGYVFDGEVRAFDSLEVELAVLQDDGSTRSETLAVRRSVHGPVIAQSGSRALAVAFPLPDREEAESPQFWQMMRASDVDAFLAALEPQNLFALNFLYADRHGTIAYALNGIFPDRPAGDYDWGGTLPGDTSATLWRGKLPFSAMPVVVNPASGTLQSANEPPHYAAWPTPVDLSDAPADWPAARAWPRTRRSLTLLASQETFSVEDVMRLKFDTRSGLADQVLDTVLAVGRQYGSPEAQEAVEVLAAWDRTFEPGSIGALVFAFWAMNYEEGVLGGTPFPADAFAVPFDPARPTETPAGLADPGRAVEALEFAARAVKQTFGSLQVPWGAFFTFHLGDVALPAFGAPPEAFGLFSPNFAAPTEQGPLATVAGDTWVAVIEFGDEPRAWAVLPYGNATQAGDPHAGDQLELYAGKGFRPVWTSRADVEANLEFRETPAR